MNQWKIKKEKRLNKQGSRIRAAQRCHLEERTWRNCPVIWSNSKSKHPFTQTSTWHVTSTKWFIAYCFFDQYSAFAPFGIQYTNVPIKFYSLGKSGSFSVRTANCNRVALPTLLIWLITLVEFLHCFPTTTYFPAAVGSVTWVGL